MPRSIRPSTSSLAELLDEALIVAVDSDQAGGAAAVVPQAPSTGSRAPFSGLRLQRYNDLEVMLLADPIHEVDDTGWPMPVADAGK